MFLNLDKNLLKELLGNPRRLKKASSKSAKAASPPSTSRASASASASTSSSSSSSATSSSTSGHGRPREGTGSDDAKCEYDERDIDTDAEDDSGQDEDDEEEEEEGANAADADAADSDVEADADADADADAAPAPAPARATRGRGGAHARGRGCASAARTRAVADDVPPAHDASSSGRVLTDAKCIVIQERIKRMNMPREYGRMPLKIASGFARLKADELKVLFAIAMPTLLLHDMLRTKSVGTRAPVVNENAPLHRLIITALCFINRFVCMRPITEFALRLLDELTMRFTCVFMHAYPATKYPSVHLASHLAECCRLYGPASAFWTFLLERLQGLLAATHNNYTHVGLTTCQRFLLSQALTDISRLRVRSSTDASAEMVGLADLCTQLGVPIAWFEHDNFHRVTSRPPPAGNGASFALDVLGEWYWCPLRLHHPVYHAALTFLGNTKWPVPSRDASSVSAAASSASSASFASSSSSSSTTATPPMFAFAFSSDTMGIGASTSASTSTSASASSSTAAFSSSSSSSSSASLHDDLVGRADFTQPYGDSSRRAHHRVPLFVWRFPAAPHCVSPSASCGNLMELLHGRRPNPNKIVVPGQLAWTAQQLVDAFQDRIHPTGRFAQSQHSGFSVYGASAPTTEYRVARILSARVFKRLLIRPNDEACKIDSLMWSRRAERSLVLVCCPHQDEFVHRQLLQPFADRAYSNDRSLLHPAIVCAFVQFDCDLVHAQYARHTPNWQQTLYQSSSASGFVAAAPAIFAVVKFLRPHQHAACFQWNSLAEMWDFNNQSAGTSASFLIPVSRICSRAAGARLTSAEVADLDAETHHEIINWASRSFDKAAAPIIVTPLPSH